MKVRNKCALSFYQCLKRNGEGNEHKQNRKQKQVSPDRKNK